MLRSVLTAALALMLALMLPGALAAQPVPKAAPITMVINQSPWFDGFRRLVDAYEKETGNKIELDVNPYAGALEKVRNSLRAGQGTYDLLAIDNNWMVEMFAAGYLLPIDQLEPGFKLDPKVSTYGGTIFWNAAARTFDPQQGRLMGVPINGNVEVLFYRADLYEKAGLKVPETWDQLLANVVKLNDAPRVYGLVHRDDRTSTTADFSNYLFSQGGGLFASPSTGDWTVTLNSAAALKALEFYLDSGKKGGYPSPGSVSQGQLFQLLATGKAAHAIGVVAAFGQLEDASKSAVVGKVNAALIPRGADGQHASRAGHWIGAIAHNVPRERQLAALTFLKWFTGYERQVAYTRFGAVPVRTDIGESDLAKETRFRWLKPMAENAAVARMAIPVPEAQQIFAVTDLRLNEAVLGQLKPAEALNRASQQVYEIMTKAGYKTGKLPDLAK